MGYFTTTQLFLNIPTRLDVKESQKIDKFLTLLDDELNYAITSLQDFYFESKRTKLNGAESLINFTINQLIIAI